MTHMAGPGGPHDRDGVVVDTRGAVLLDHIHTCMIGLNGDAARPGIAMDLGGRVNKSSARSTVLYLFDLVGAAKLAADLIGLCARAERADELMGLISAHLAEQL